MPPEQLVEIARALGAGARILIMDEPTASLTATEVDLLLGLVKDLRSQGVGVIYISHRLEEVFQVADRVTVLRDGESVGTREVGARTVPVRSGQEFGAADHVPIASTKSDALRTGTVRAPLLTESELIKMMVGRELS